MGDTVYIAKESERARTAGRCVAETVKKMSALGLDVIVQKGAGVGVADLR